ncbi:MAG TPA: HAMP domain-containing sensor histidine kinase [Candidatus Angelobacter sp.]|nr:HAMP domain-containing sensor histidine kinase [Candidatus Angelobacter sp.]
MALLLAKLPTMLVLAVLVGIFIALRQHVKSNRLHLWIGAWLLIFIHFVCQAFDNLPSGPTVLDAIDFSALQLSAVVFIASLTDYSEDTEQTWQFLALSCPPVLIYSFAYGFNRDWRLVYVLCLVTLYFGNVVFGLLRPIKERYEHISRLLLVAFVGAFSIYRAWRHNYDTGFHATLTLTFFLTGWLFWKIYRRFSPGVVTSVGGFLLWSGVFPLSIFLNDYYPNAQVNPELWNTPKYFVALGMILTLLEDKSAMLEETNLRERTLNQQLQKFSAITSRLLNGIELTQICAEIADAITETSIFRRVAIVLSAEDNSFYLAASSGIDDAATAELRQKTTACKPADLSLGWQTCPRLGLNSYLVGPEQIEKYLPLHPESGLASNIGWRSGSEIIVPLQSARDTMMGWMALDNPRNTSRANGEEMSKIELLATDLAVTIDNNALHRQLVRSEKLAAIGQLVAGVAHELNNPLASVVGYSELLSDDISDGPARQKLDKLLREAHRMRRIIDNLLRFARQNNLEKKSADLQSLLLDVLTLREYHIRNNDIEVQVIVEPDLPPVALDEDQFKQILLNLLNNSIDALEGARPKQVRIEAIRQEERVILRFDDSGPGFAEVNRAFDPFYTTKPIGKGTGLGLSICYGIVKEHGGDIYALNLEPQGARIVLELPVDRAGSSPAQVSLQQRTV